jgi:NAD(P)-dependent dehydrogenase (short-subunit alcohol dehydrogenase family)
MEFSQRVAVITGGGSGIGRAVAAAMARRDIRAVALVDVSEAIEDVAEQLNAEAGRDFAIPFHGNTTDEAFRGQVFDSIGSRFGPVSMCVPAAGITRDDLAVRIDKNTGKARIYPLEQFKLVVDVNLIAPVYWALEMIGRIAEDRAARGRKRWTPDEGMQGSVVFIGSISSQGNRGQISYASTKAGLEGAAAGDGAAAVRVAAALGDPMQPLAAAMVLAAAAAGRPVLLAGGSQMAAVLALALALAPPSLRPAIAAGTALGTTAWVADEAGSDLALLLRRIGERWGVEPLAFAADLRFAAPCHPALAAYERGYVKEGVGAGGLALLWQLSGRPGPALARLCDQACATLLGPPPPTVR